MLLKNLLYLAVVHFAAAKRAIPQITATSLNAAQSVHMKAALASHACKLTSSQATVPCVLCMLPLLPIPDTNTFFASAALQANPSFSKVQKLYFGAKETNKPKHLEQDWESHFSAWSAGLNGLAREDSKYVSGVSEALKTGLANMAKAQIRVINTVVDKWAGTKLAVLQERDGKESEVGSEGKKGGAEERIV